MDTFNDIKKLIDNLEFYASDEDVDAGIIMKAQYKIFNQFETAAQAQWTKSELKDFVFRDDVVDFVDAAVVADSFKDDLREIQKEIIDFFGEEQ